MLHCIMLVYELRQCRIVYKNKIFSENIYILQSLAANYGSARRMEDGERIRKVEHCFLFTKLNQE